MSNYKFLIPVLDEYSPINYIAVTESTIKDLVLADTYDRDGQTVGSYYAGDYIDEFSKKALVFAKKNEIKIDDDHICAYNDQDDFNTITSNSDLKEGVDYALNQRTIKGITYYDGSNFKTAVIETDEGVNDYELLEDEELEKELNEAIINSSFKSEGSGITNYTSGSYFIHTSRWQSCFGRYYFTDENI